MNEHHDVSPWFGFLIALAAVLIVLSVAVGEVALAALGLVVLALAVGALVT